MGVSRPDVIDRAALIEALRSGKLGGFALDPLYQAPARDDDELLQFKNVILTPHIAAQPRRNALADFAEAIIAATEGATPPELTLWQMTVHTRDST